MKFDQYPIAPAIKENLKALGFKRPTDIQYKSIPSILKGEDVLAIAQTGTGKTAAFAIPVINLIEGYKKRKKKPGIKCLVMVPTHELALQVGDVFNTLSKNTGVRIYSIYGGVEQSPQIEKLQKGVDILVATPGRMFDLRSQGHLDLKNVAILILDEADHMLDLGFIKDIRDLMQYIPKKRQTLFFSATINKKIKTLAYSLVRKAIRIQISPKDRVSKNIHHSVAFMEMDHKRFFLERVVREKEDSKILVFVRTKVRAERVAKAMGRVNIDSYTLHSGKDQKERTNVLKRFKAGTEKLLIATDVSARGIDIPNVDYVINYDLPDKAENYVHRVGRTGRGTQRGHAVSFCAPNELPLLDEIESFLGKKIEVMEIKPTDYRDTLDFSEARHQDLTSLMQEIEEREKKNKRKKGKRIQ